MSVIKITGLSSALLNSALRQSLGINVNGYAAFTGIYQGSPPNIVDVVNNVTTFRASDLLWSSEGSANTVLPLGYQLNGDGFFYPKKPGIAGWFLCAGIDKATRNIMSFITGRVSESGGDGDLILSSTTLESNNKYRIHQLKLNIPYSFTY